MVGEDVALGGDGVLLEQLEAELPPVFDGQIPMGDILSRVVQNIYAELVELAETMPNMSDSARKRTLADWVVKTKKQVVKMYAVVKWARDADVVQKSMNITAFLLNQNHQFLQAIEALNYAKDSLAPARLRNHDLLTSLDVLTTGTYQRLPSKIKKIVIPPTSLTDEEVAKTLTGIEHAIRYRLHLHEIIPVEMSLFRIFDGRAHFTSPKRFEASLCLQGPRPADGWFLVHVKFLFDVGMDTGTLEYPKEPFGLMKQHIIEEADSRLAHYLPLPADLPPPPPGVEPPSRPELPPDTVDAPLVRLFNFLNMMALSYQLEILLNQAQRMQTLGWGEYMDIEVANDRRNFTVSYWKRKTPLNQPPPSANRIQIPQYAGKCTVAIVDVPSRLKTGGPERSPCDRVLAELQDKSKISQAQPSLTLTSASTSAGIGTLTTTLAPTRQPSDMVQGLALQVTWEPTKNAMGLPAPFTTIPFAPGELFVDPDNLDFEQLLRKVLKRHASSILYAFETALKAGFLSTVFSEPDDVVIRDEDGLLELRVHLVADEIVIISLDLRTGRFMLRDAGDLAVATTSRFPRFPGFSERLNENPIVLLEYLVKLRWQTIIELAQNKANYLGMQVFRKRNMPPDEMKKFGHLARDQLFIQLRNFPQHYLVLVITDAEFRFALISMKLLPETPQQHMVIEDIGWLVLEQIRGNSGGGLDMMHHQAFLDVTSSAGRKLSGARFILEAQVLRELYAYCCARVSYTKVEQQLKLRGIHYTNVSPSLGIDTLDRLQSTLARSVPAICVQSSDILAGVPAAEAAMPNIRVVPLNWWSDEKAQVVFCVKLKYVQQPVGKNAGSSAMIRPSKRVIYDTRQAIVSFLSDNVDTCVDEFLEEWAKVSKMVVIAREVARMAKDSENNDIRLLSFDLQTVEFAYAAGYVVSIRCTDQILTSDGSYDLRFSCEDKQKSNPHEDAEPYLRNVLRSEQLAWSLQTLVGALRDTLPIVTELARIRTVAVEEGVELDTFAKTASWFRILYGDLRHALDFRLEKGQRVNILDGSFSLFESTGGSAKGKARDEPPVPHALRPIPDFRTLVLETIHEVTSTQSVGKVADLHYGLQCDTSAVALLAGALHRRVLQRLRGPA